MKLALPVFEEENSTKVNSAYIKYIAEAGFIPIIIPAYFDFDRINSLITFCDGLILPGGVDIEPTYYNMENSDSYSPDPERDGFERYLYKTFKSMKKPILGICRGFQLIFLEEGLEDSGFTYTQNITGNKHNQLRKHVKRHTPFHKIFYCDFLYNAKSKNLLFNKQMFVNSFHHQGVTFKRKKKTKKSLEELLKAKESKKVKIIPLAYSSDGLLEAFWVADTNIYAVQWHPEELKDYTLLKRVFSKEIHKKVKK